MSYGWKIDHFSGSAAMLKGRDRNVLCVLSALRKDPKLSCFDLSEYAWLRNAVNTLVRAGRIKMTDKLAYPWQHFEVFG